MLQFWELVRKIHLLFRLLDHNRIQLALNIGSADHCHMGHPSDISIEDGHHYEYRPWSLIP